MAVTLASLLTQTVTIVSAPAAPDDRGNLVRDWDTATRVDAAARLEPNVTSEVTDGRDSVLTDARLFLHPDAFITAYDRVEADGLTYEVVGTPGLQRMPRGPHHFEVDLRRLEL